MSAFDLASTNALSLFNSWFEITAGNARAG
jgi:hypothetical protein